MELSGKTKVYGIIGDPVSHSLSPLLQGRFFDRYGVDAVYVPFRVASRDLRKAVDGLWAADVAGLNVTVPHKEAILDAVHTDRDARVIGAVNTLMRDTAGWRGVNTDWLGFREVLAALEAELRDTDVLMFGAGGTARAVLHALAAENVGRVRICNRSEGRLMGLLEHARGMYPGLQVEALAWEQREVDRACETAALIVNTTSIGLDRGASSFPFVLRGVAAVDVVYTLDGETPFVDAARRGGARAVDGLPLLVAQGAVAFRCWRNEFPHPLPALRWMEARLGRAPAELPGWEGSR